MTLVVDASVALKWFVDEALSATAHELLRRSELLFAPDLIIAEIGNTVWRKAIRNEMSQGQANDILAAMRSGEVALYPSTDLAQRALGIALVLNHPVYDCLYLACAELVDGVLVTADERLRKAVDGTNLASLVRPLRDIGNRPP